MAANPYALICECLKIDYEIEVDYGVAKQMLHLSDDSMERKWDKCKDMPLSKKEGNLKGQIIELIKLGLKNKEISLKLNINPSYVSRLNKELKNG